MDLSRPAQLPEFNQWLAMLKTVEADNDRICLPRGRKKIDATMHRLHIIFHKS